MAATAGPDGSKWQRRVHQSRSHRTQDVILQAAEDLFARDGVAATSVNDVAARAERAVGSVYHHFTDKETLVKAVVDRITIEVEAGIAAGLDPARWIDQDILDIARGYLTDAIALDRTRPGYKRIINEVALIDPDARQRHVALRQQVNTGLTALILQRRESIGHPNPDLAVGFIVDQLSSMLLTRLDPEFNPTELSRLDDDIFIEEAVTSVRSHLDVRD